jgi:hypothetical protein
MPTGPGGPVGAIGFAAPPELVVVALPLVAWVVKIVPLVPELFVVAF